MNTSQAIQVGLDMADYISMAYLADLTDEQLLHRPCAGANHIAWQIGHLIVSEHDMVEKICPGAMPALPAGFRERYTKETADSDSARQFDSKDALLAAHAAQRAGTLKMLAIQTAADLDKPSGLDYAPTACGVFSMQGSHWLMHAGQWAIIRRQLGKPPLF